MIFINMDPVAFHIGFLEVRWYGIFIALAVATMVLWTWRQITKNEAKLPKNANPNIMVFSILSGLVAARLFHVVDRWDFYSQNLGAIFGGAGLSIYGGVIGATLFFWVYSRVTRSPFGFFADLAAPGIILSQAVGRIGCTINGCCFGKLCALAAPSWLPWGIVYTHPNSYAPLGVPLIPTTIYEIIFAMSLFGILLKLRGKLKPDGSLFLVYLISYSTWRIGSGFLREGVTFAFGSFIFPFHQAQLIAIIILTVTVPILVVTMRRAKSRS